MGNLGLLAACEKLTDEQLDTRVVGTYGTIRETLVHLAGAEELYLHMMRGLPRPPRREDEGFRGFAQLRELLAYTGQELVNMAESNSFPKSYHDPETDELLTSGMVVILIINHATEHRAHINSTLSHLGLEPRELDGWAYGWTHGLLTMFDRPKENAE